MQLSSVLLAHSTRPYAIIPDRGTSSLQITAVCVIRSKAITEAIKLQPTNLVLPL